MNKVNVEDRHNYKEEVYLIQTENTFYDEISSHIDRYTNRSIDATSYRTKPYYIKVS